MIVTCDSCNTSFNLDGSLLKPTGTMVRCSKCKHVFKAYPEAPPQEPAPTPPVAEATAQAAPPEEKPPEDADKPEKTPTEAEKPLADQSRQEDQDQQAGDDDGGLLAAAQEYASETDSDAAQTEAPAEDTDAMAEDDLQLSLEDDFGAATKQIVLEADDAGTDFEKAKPLEDDIEQIDFGELGLEIASDETTPEQPDEITAIKASKPDDTLDIDQAGTGVETLDDDLDLDNLDMDLDLKLEVEDKAPEPEMAAAPDTVADDTSGTMETAGPETEAMDLDLDLDLDLDETVAEEESPDSGQLDLDLEPLAAADKTTETDALELDLTADEKGAETSEEELDLDSLLEEDTREDSDGAAADMADAKEAAVEDFEFDLDFGTDAESDEESATDKTDELDLEPAADAEVKAGDDLAEEIDFDLDLDETDSLDESDTAAVPDADAADDSSKEEELDFDLEAVLEPGEDETSETDLAEETSETDILAQQTEFDFDDLEEEPSPDETKPPAESEDQLQEEPEIDDTLLDEELEQPLPAAAPVKKKKIGAPILVALILAIIAGGGYGAYWYLDQQNIKIPFISKLTAPKAPDPGQLKIDFFDIDAKFINNQKAGKLFVISGKVKNGYKSPRSFIRITGKLYQKKKKLVKTSTVYCGNTLSELELSSFDAPAIAKKLANLFGDQRSNVKVAPGKVLPFVVVFSDIPDNLEEYTIEVAGSSPAGK